MANLVCPQCGSTKLRRSHARGVVEQLKRSLGWQGFRCRNQMCDWRGMIWVEFGSATSKYARYAFLIVAFILLLFLSARFVLFLTEGR